GMEMMGAVMISALVVFPAMSSMFICKSFKRVVISSAIIGIICFIIGFFAACCLSLQTGPAVVSVHVIVFLIFAVIGMIK
ncbi:MAG: metal ABC transporter permease, partial [Clostridia bacterium]|nr:metal ABC transporter permease [Clostridia bacterium]